jgi:hypothetical protein
MGATGSRSRRAGIVSSCGSPVCGPVHGFCPSPRGVGSQIANAINPNDRANQAQRKNTTMTDDKKPERSEADRTSEEELDRILGKDARIKLDGEIDKICDRSYAKGVSDAQAQARNPNHRMRFSMKEFRESDHTAASVPAKTPYELAERARQIQDEAAKNGQTISNADSVRMAYVENNIPWQ